MSIITLQHQFEWSEKCLIKMIEGNRPQEELDLQEAVRFTLQERIREKSCQKAYILENLPTPKQPTLSND